MKLIFIWHMHQPYYKDLTTGEYLMPWVRLHGCKDYLDMLLLLDEFPRIRQTFNLVPSLLEQIIDYAENDVNDRYLYLSRKRASDLTEDEKVDLCDKFFAANYSTMIRAYPRYHELYHRCQNRGRHDAILRMRDQDFLDLQVWFNAVWVDPLFRGAPEIKNVYAKGLEFTEEEKQRLLDFQTGILRRIVPSYRERQDHGKIEISFSPYYHPILPLLIDSQSAKESAPDAVLPQKRYMHPEDAIAQVKMAGEMYHQLFGEREFGMWPSEGSVSEAIIPILKRERILWIASDEEILFSSLKSVPRPADPVVDLHRPYRVGKEGEQVGMLFRDHRLSDKIGFVYSNWDAEKAAEDFVNDLRKIASSRSSSRSEPVISIILDGENCWEMYKNDGLDFLRALYEEIGQDPGIETVLPSEVFRADNSPPVIPRLFAGSWIDHNFRIWIGHTEDNAAWDLLSLTRDQLEQFSKSHPEFDRESLALAWKEIYIAEGSDWYWWYGDDHYSDYFEIFDHLFRKHLLNIWGIMGLDPPSDLRLPIRKLAVQAGILHPTDFLSPIIDGKQSHFFEWFGAGKVDCRKLGGSMHRAGTRITQISFGYDDEKIYFRVDFEKNGAAASEGGQLQLELACEDRLFIKIAQTGVGIEKASKPIADDLLRKITMAWDEIVELAVPRECMACEKSRHLYFALSFLDKEKVVERWPEANYIYTELPKRGENYFWQV